MNYIMKKRSLTHKVRKLLLNVLQWFRGNNRRNLRVFHKDYFTFYNRGWNSKLETNFGITYRKCSMKLLSDLIVKIGILEIWNINFRAILILGLIWTGKYFIKTIFDTKIRIGIFDISNVPNFNNFRGLLIWGLFWAEQVVRA